MSIADRRGANGRVGRRSPARSVASTGSTVRRVSAADRAALVRAFNQAATYDENARVAMAARHDVRRVAISALRSPRSTSLS